MRTIISKISWELLLTCIITIIGWAYTAGTLSAKIEDTQNRLDRVEIKLDNLTAYDVREHGGKVK